MRSLIDQTHKQHTKTLDKTVQKVRERSSKAFFKEKKEKTIEANARLQKLGKFMQKKEQKSQKVTKKVSSEGTSTVLKVFCVLLPLVQLGWSLFILLLQYLSQKISLNLFCALLVLSLILTLFAILSQFLFSNTPFSFKSRICPQNLKEPQNIFIEKEMHTPDFPQINQEQPLSHNTTIRKIKATIYIPKNETVKVLSDTEKDKAKTKKNKQNKQLSWKFFIITNLLQVLETILMASIVLGVLENPKKQGGTLKIVVLISSYPISIASIIISVIRCLKIKQSENVLDEEEKKVQAHQQDIVLNTKEQKKPKTSISIAVEEIAQSSDNVKKNIQTNKSIVKFQEKPVFEQKNEIVKSEVASQSIKVEEHIQLPVNNEMDDTELLKSKKSVLKTSQRKTTPLDLQKQLNQAEQEIIEKKRVQINQKKIQYFEYLRISPASSVVDFSEEYSDSRSRRGLPTKTRINPKSKYQRQKLTQQSKLLQKKKEINKQLNNKVQLSKTHTQRPEKSEKEEGEQGVKDCYF